MGFRLTRPFLFAAALAALATSNAQAQRSGEEGYQDPVAEAAAAALEASNLAADARLGSLGLPVTSFAPPLVLPETGKALMATSPDWNVAPTVKPLLQVPIKAIFVQDDDGGRPCAINSTEVNLWKQRANLIWSGSGIEFTFDPGLGSTDYITVNSTLLNDIGETSSPLWPAQFSLASAYSAIWPDKLVMFFRHGPGASPTGGGFSWTSMNFIMMPGFTVTGVCGVQNIGLMAHEIGHYLGLPHTFAKEFGSYAEAEAYFALVGAPPNSDVYEGDGRDQTEPDPFIDTTAYQCSSTSVTIYGYVFELPRDNVMSYYHPITEVVESQFHTARQTWAVRTGKPMHELILGGQQTFEAENLSGTITGGFWLSQTMDSFLGKWSNNTQQVWLDGAIGATMRLDFPVATAGFRDVYASFTAAPDFGTLEVTLNDVPCPGVELYAGLVLPTGPVFLGTHYLPAGTSKLRLKVTGNDPRADFPRQGVGVDYVVLAAPSVESKEVVRVGFPANPDVFRPGVFGGPYVGNLWAPYVDHTSFVTDATLDVMVISAGTANFWIGFQGTVLVDLAKNLWTYSAFPGAHWSITVPINPALVGLIVRTQAGSLSLQGYFKLTNALDLTIGSY